MDYLEDLRFSVKYPFTELARVLVSRMGITFDSLEPRFIDRARQRIEEDIRGGVNLNLGTKLTSVLEAELVSYPLAKVLVALSRNSFLIRRFVDGETSTLRRHLMLESDEVLERVARELGVNFAGKRVHFKSYLRFLPKDESYKLVYQEVESGFVKVDKTLVVELLVSAYARKLQKELEIYPRDLEHLKKYLEGLMIERRETFEYKGPINADAFPPCIKKLLSDAAAGVHLSHNARFALATFLANAGLEKDKIVDVFRNQDNFNEKLTYYHVEYILGERGSGKRKLPPSCEKMKLYGLCVNPDRLCQRIRNPFGYYRAKLRPRRGAENGS